MAHPRYGAAAALEWATTRTTGLPKNVQPKSDEGFAALKSYADRLKADIVGFQEVDGADAVSRVFDPVRYDVVVADENDVQRVGFAVRKGVPFTRNPDVAGLDLHPTRKCARTCCRRSARRRVRWFLRWSKSFAGCCAKTDPVVRKCRAGCAKTSQAFNGRQ